MQESWRSKSILNVFHSLFKKQDSDRVYVSTLIDTLGARSFGFVLLLMALPNALLIASIPGLSSILGGAIAFTSLQMILRFKVIWLPKTVRNRAYKKIQLEKILKISTPFLRYVECFLKPRILKVSTTFFEPFLGFIVLINSIWIMLPIPFGNFFPGVAIVVLSLGMIAKDGIFIIAGVTLSLLVWLGLGFMYSSVLFILMRWIGL